MANAHRGLLEVEIAGDKKNLRYTLNALAVIADNFGIKYMSEFANRINDLGPIELRFVLWQGLLHETPKLKLEEVGNWDLDMIDIQNKVALAFLLAYRGNREVTEEEEQDPSKLAKNLSENLNPS